MQHCDQIVNLLMAMMTSKAAAIMIRGAHHRDNSCITRGSAVADREAKQAALVSSEAIMVTHMEEQMMRKDLLLSQKEASEAEH